MSSKIKLEIEKQLYYNDVLFSTKVKKFGDKIQLYFITKNSVGIAVCFEAKVKYFIADSKRIDWALQEGFTEEQINKEFLIFETAKTLKSFVNKLSDKPKKARKKVKVKK